MRLGLAMLMWARHVTNDDMHLAYASNTTSPDA
jgi:hypothetical protein